MSRVRRLLASVLGTIAVLLFAALCILIWYRHSAQPRTSGEVRIAGLRAPVTISRDSFGIPSIWARNEHDMLLAQGYVHAQDRLWQMEMMRHVGEGRLSELFGARVLATDRFLRVFGLPRAAALQDSALDAVSRNRIAAYVEGVNAFLNEKRTLPPEFRILGVKPQPWTVRHTLAIEKVMALNLSQYFLALNRTRSVNRLGAARAAALQPRYPSWGPLIVEIAASDGNAAFLPEPPPVPEIAQRMVAAGSISHASNAWVIGGARTASGKPILANDMHLELSAPPIWYLVALHSDSADVAGMSIPGSPFVVAGHNRAVAWGLTNVMLDDADLFIERIDPADSTRYLTPDGSAQFQYVTDTIRVKGQDRPELLRYRMTRHGPVMSDVETGIATGRDVIAMQWVGAQPSHTMIAMPLFMHASNWSQFRSAVAMFDDPHQNVVYADTAGNIGYQMGGRVPDRGARLPPSLPVPGWTGDWDWRGFIPFAQQPSVFNPAQGYVVTANNRQAAGALADRISDGWETPFRAARIREMILTSNRKLTAADVHAMQLDVHDGTAARYRDRAIAAASGNSDVVALLTSWDNTASRASKAAAVFYLFYDRMRHHLARSLYGNDSGWIDRAIVDEALENRAVAWPARGSTARLSFDSIAKLAMVDAIRMANGRTWGETHHITAEHPLGSVAALERVLELNIGAAPGDGSPTSVNVSWAKAPVREGSNTIFNATLGPSQRHVVDMSDVDRFGGFILPGGQSGIPFSAHYRDQWPRWLNGGLTSIPLQRAGADARTISTLTLLPGAK